MSDEQTAADLLRQVDGDRKAAYDRAVHNCVVAANVGAKGDVKHFAAAARWMLQQRWHKESKPRKDTPLSDVVRCQSEGGFD